MLDKNPPDLLQIVSIIEDIDFSAKAMNLRANAEDLAIKETDLTTLEKQGYPDEKRVNAQDSIIT